MFDRLCFYLSQISRCSDNNSRNDVTRARASAERGSLEAGTGRLDESLQVHRVSPGQPRVLAWESFTPGLYTATQDTLHCYR